MTTSMRDQLLALGFAKSKPESSKPVPTQGKGARSAPRPPSSSPAQQRPARQGQAHDRPPRTTREPDLAAAYALRDKSEREQRAQVQREAQEKARLRKEAKAKLTALLDGKALNDAAAEQARHFEYGGKIRRVYTTPEQLVALNLGELGVVQFGGRYLLVPRETALAAAEIQADALVLLPDPNAPVEDDVPPDLVW